MSSALGLALALSCRGPLDTAETTESSSTATTTGSQVAVEWTDLRIEASSTLNAVYTGGTGAWVAGTGGAVWYVAPDGSSRAVDVQTSEDLYGIWGIGDGESADVVVVGNAGSALHVDEGLDAYDLGAVALYDVDGVPDDLTAVGWGGVYRFDGGDWALESVPVNAQLNSVVAWGMEAIAVGNAGAIVHRDSGGWHAADSPVSIDLHGVHGRAVDDVWAVGTDGVVVHWDGRTWSTVDAGIAHTLWAVWQAPTGEAFVVGNNGVVAIGVDGDFRSSETSLQHNLYAVHGSTAQAVWVTGNRGQVLAYAP